MTATSPSWLEVREGDAPLIVAFPHTGTEIPDEIAGGLVSPWLARRDADWWVDRLYDFAAALGATTVRTTISRSAVDVNRDPSGASLYPGQTTTELCPTVTFDGEPLHRNGQAPDEAEIVRRRSLYFDPYHGALAAQIDRLKTRHPAVVLYDAHSIRSRIPRLFDGELPQFNIGTNDGLTCAAGLTEAVTRACAASALSQVVNGRFKGGWTARRYGRPAEGVHAIQMELACRGYMAEPSEGLDPTNWPGAYDPARAAPMRAILTDVLKACLAFAHASD